MHSSAPPQIPGTQIPNAAAAGLRDIVAELLDRPNTRFPGAQPVSFAREHIAELNKAEYFMCEKTDGVRCLLFLSFKEGQHPDQYEPLTFFIDRKNNYYEVNPPLRFPYHEFPNDADKFLFNTILDGELVHDRTPGQPKPRLIFYVFDCLVMDGHNLTRKSLDKRLGRLKANLFQPYHNYCQRHNGPPAQEPFRVKEKQIYPPYSLETMFHQVLPNLPHGNDGLVFTCKNTHYEFGTDKHILKWKPPHENTIDFKLRLGEFPVFDPEDGEEGLIPDYDAMPDRFELLVQHNQNSYHHFADLHVTEQDWEILKSLNQRLDGRIIECYRATSGTWHFKKDDDGTPRWRDDKKDANHISTVNSVLESIEDPVTMQDLLKSAASIKESIYRIRAEEQERHRVQNAEERERDAKKRKFSEINGH